MRTISISRRCRTHSIAGLGLGGQVLDDLLQGRGFGRGQVGRLVALFEEEEGGDGADAELKGEVGDLVGVEAGECVLFGEAERGGKLVEKGRDGLAGAAPDGVGLQGDVGRRFEQLVELGLGLDVNDGHDGRLFCGVLRVVGCGGQVFFGGGGVVVM